MSKTLKRMRTINDSLKLIKANDPNSAITYYFIKKLCEEKLITAIQVGRKWILNYDELLVYCNISSC